MTEWAGPEFGWVQVLSWLIVIGFWVAVAFFGWKFFMPNPMDRDKKHQKKR